MTVGFKIIREMTKEEMIAELLEGQRVLFGEQSEETLKHYIIQARTHFTQRRLVEEADLNCNHGGPRGFLGLIGDDE